MPTLLCIYIAEVYIGHSRCHSKILTHTRCTGNVIGPLLYSTEEAPLYRKGLISNLCMFVTVGVVAAYVYLVLEKEML